MILAEAGLVRLGLDKRVRERVPLKIMLPAVGQGALGIVCAAGNHGIRDLLRTVLHHEPTGVAVDAERGFLRRLEGGCSVPVGAYATVAGESLEIAGCVGSVDGARVVRDRLSGRTDNAAEVGTALADRLLRAGAADILVRLK